MTDSSASLLRTLFASYGRRYFGAILGLTGFTLVANFFLILQPVVLAGVLATILGQGGSGGSEDSSIFDLNHLGTRVVEWVQVHGAVRGSILITLGILFVTVALLGAFVEYCGSIVSLRIRESAMNRMQNDALEALLRLDLSYFYRHRAGDLMSWVAKNAAGAAIGTADNLRALLQHGILLALYSVFLLSTSLWLASAAFVLITLQFAFTRILQRPARRRNDEVFASSAQLNSRLQETFSNIRVIKSFSAEQTELSRLRAAVAGSARAVYRQAQLGSMERPARGLANSFAVMGIFAVAAIEMAAGRLTPEGLILFVYVGRLVVTPATALAMSVLSLQELAAGFAPIRRIFRETPRVVDGPITKTSITDRIEVHDVSFAYGPGHPAIHGVSLNVRKGEVVALVGPSGAGKSTLADLILRLYDPDNGQITIDGIDVKDLKQGPYRKLFGVVSQESILYHASVRENIRHGRPDVQDEDVVWAAKMAHADEFIRRLPSGYETTIGDRGVRLSGGERQRVAIARALAQRPPILIFDEATSQLDSESERQVQLAVDEMTKGSTAIIIAHRLSTVRKADKIVVIDRGRIIDVGRHDELLARCPLYQRLCSLQFGPSSHEEPLVGVEAPA